MNDGDPLVLFDGICNLCSASMQFLALRDRQNKLRYASMQSATGQEILTRHNLPTDDYDSFVLLEDGRLWFKSSACLRLLSYMKWPWPLLRVAGIVPRFILDWAYDRLARNRYALFGKRQTCMLPKAELADRFLT